MVTPIQIVKNYNDLIDELYDKAIDYLYITILEEAWGKELDDVYLDDGDVVMVISNGYIKKKYWTIRFNDKMEISI